MDASEVIDPGPAIVEIVCERGLVADALSTGLLVFVDGVWRFDAEFGIPTRSSLDPGKHVIRIWDRKVNYNSNELTLEFEAGATRSLVCSRTPTSKLRPTRGVVGRYRFFRDILRNGGVIVGGFLLEEVDSGAFRLL